MPGFTITITIHFAWHCILNNTNYAFPKKPWQTLYLISSLQRPRRLTMQSGTLHKRFLFCPVVWIVSVLSKYWNRGFDLVLTCSESKFDNFKCLKSNKNANDSGNTFMLVFSNSRYLILLQTNPKSAGKSSLFPTGFPLKYILTHLTNFVIHNGRSNNWFQEMFKNLSLVADWKTGWRVAILLWERSRCSREGKLKRWKLDYTYNMI